MKPLGLKYPVTTHDLYWKTRTLHDARQDYKAGRLEHAACFLARQAAGQYRKYLGFDFINEEARHDFFTSAMIDGLAAAAEWPTLKIRGRRAFTTFRDHVYKTVDKGLNERKKASEHAHGSALPGTFAPGGSPQAWAIFQAMASANTSEIAEDGRQVSLQVYSAPEATAPERVDPWTLREFERLHKDWHELVTAVQPYKSDTSVERYAQQQRSKSKGYTDDQRTEVAGKVRAAQMALAQFAEMQLRDPIRGTWEPLGNWRWRKSWLPAGWSRADETPAGLLRLRDWLRPVSDYFIELDRAEKEQQRRMAERLQEQSAEQRAYRAQFTDAEWARQTKWIPDRDHMEYWRRVKASGTYPDWASDPGNQAASKSLKGKRSTRKP